METENNIDRYCVKCGKLMLHTFKAFGHYDSVTGEWTERIEHFWACPSWWFLSTHDKYDTRPDNELGF